MKAFIPPRPQPRKRRLSMIGELFSSRRSWFSVLTRRHYRSFSGEQWTPFRGLYFVNQPDLVTACSPRTPPISPRAAHGLDALAAARRRHLRLQRRDLAQAAAHDGSGLRPGAHPGRLPADARRHRGDGRAARARMPTATCWRSTRRRRTSPPTSSSAPSFRATLTRDGGRPHLPRLRPRSRSSLMRRACGRWPGVPKFLLRRPAVRGAPHARTIRGLLERDVDKRRRRSSPRQPSARAQGHPGLAARRRSIRSPATSSRRKELVDQIARDVPGRARDLGERARLGALSDRHAPGHPGAHARGSRRGLRRPPAGISPTSGG